ncbi:MAG: hypothetical protein FJZ90_01620 [Chloroflexi bacterium]|nr:hypothetical protein [Chloroflexota bacterium]
MSIIPAQALCTEEPLRITADDRRVLRELARRVAEIAALPIQAERARLWKALNSLRPERAMVLTTPEEGWHELMSQDDLRCEDALCRQWEWNLRWKIYRHEHIHDDYPCTGFFDVAWVVELSNYGVEEARIYGEVKGFGAYKVDPPIKEPADMAKLRPRRIFVDHEETARREALAEETLGDILRVRRRGESLCRNLLTRQLIHLRGYDQFLLDMYENPNLLHDLMAFLADEKRREWEIYEREGVLSLNNGPDNILGSGGVAHTDELPAPDFHGDVRMKDMWCFGESQETISVRPEHFHDFVLAYQLPLMDRFRLVDYGCCEPLDIKFDLLLEHIPRLRWLAVQTWANRELAAEKIGDRYVYAYKPHPAFVSSPQPDYEGAERELRETLEIARGCAVSLTLKGTLTFYNEPHRLTRWTEMAQRVVQDMV